jgi:filamentous hemagglutinin family protein
LHGPNYAITSNLGQQVGGNLFHSFGLFGLSPGESATFSGPPNVSNIVGRVTSGSQSSINGSITSTINGANLYLINPSGIVFGPNATVNVSGGFHAATADYLRMTDGTKFRATNPSGSTLSAAAPAAFGFLNASPPALTVNGSQFTVGVTTTLKTNPGQILDLVGGPVTITSGPITSTSLSGTAELFAPSGAIQVTSVAAPGEVSISATNASVSTISNFGPVNISAGSSLEVADSRGKTSGGSILIRAGTLSIADSFLDAANFGSGSGGQISLQAASQIALSDGTTVLGQAQGNGSGAAITLTTAPGGAISTSGPGNVLVQTGNAVGAIGGAGVLTVTTGTLLLSAGAIFGSQSLGSGNAAPISFDANNITVQNSIPNSPGQILTGIRSDTKGAATAALLTIDAGALSILANGEIVSNTFGTGNAGAVTVNVSGALSIDATGARISTGIGTVASPGSRGNAGTLTLNAGLLSIIGSGGLLSPSPDVPTSQPFAGLSAETQGAGSGGGVAIDLGVAGVAMGSGGVITVSTSGSGAGGSVNLASQGPLSIFGAGTGITAATFAGSSGNAGSVNVTAPQITIESGGEIATTAAGSGAGGAILVSAPGALLLDGAGVAGTGITAAALAGSTGNAGSVNVSASQITIESGGEIATSTAGAGAGGPILVSTPGALVLDGMGVARTGITAATFSGSSGNAGSVTVSASEITIESGGEIATSTAGAGAGGPILVSTPGALLLDGMGVAGTGISASATGAQSGAGGAVTAAAGSLTVQGGAQIASTTAGPGMGGDITVTVGGNVTLSGQGPQITALSTGSGNAGSILVSGLNLTMTGGATISTEASTANGGNISVSVADVMQLVSSRISTSVKGSIGNGGNILIDPQLLILDDSQIIAQAVLGHGGNITIVANQYLPSADSLVSASSALGISGTIEIIDPHIDLNGTLVVLPSELRNAAEIFRDSCAARAGRPRSSLTEAGRGGLPQDPEAMMLALYIADRDVFPAGPILTGQRAATPTMALEAVPVTMRCQ